MAMHHKPWIVISARALRDCVYVWKKSNPDGADRVMYVGSSVNGIRRLSGHHVLPAEYKDEDYIELFPCPSQEDAMRLEARLINELSPEFNKKIPLFETADDSTSKPLGVRRHYFNSKGSVPCPK